MGDVEWWISVGKVGLNLDKTVAILFGSRTVFAKLGKFLPVNILGNLLSTAETVENLGVWSDSDLSSCHVWNICKACFVHSRDLKQHRGCLSCGTPLLAVGALVKSCLGCCGSLFVGISALGL